MRTTLPLLPRIALVSAALAYASSSWAVTAGTLLFAQPGVEIIDTAGVKRPARQGDVLHEGERLLTPPNAIAQIGLADGSLLGLCPGSELKVELPAAASDQAKKVVTLLQGAIRVIGAELMEKTPSAPLTLQSGIASMQLRGADIETELVRPEASPRTDAMAPGTYSKLLVGSGVLKSGDVSTSLAPRQVTFLGSLAPAPTLVSAMPTKTLAMLPSAPISTDTKAPLKTPTLAPIANLTTSLPTSKLLIAPMPGAPTPVIAGPAPATLGAPKPGAIATAPVALAPPPVIKTPVYVAPLPPPVKIPTYVPPPTKCGTVKAGTICIVR